MLGLIGILAKSAAGANINGNKARDAIARGTLRDENRNAGVKNMRLIRLAAAGLVAGGMGFAAVAAAPASAAEPQRITVTGEVIDSWCYLSEIMWATGSAHHRCAVWCARGGVPVGILSEDDEEVYVVLMMEDNPDVIGNKAIFRMQTNEVVVTGDLYERDSVKYLAVNEIVEDHGIVNYSHEDFDIQPGGL